MHDAPKPKASFAIAAIFGLFVASCKSQSPQTGSTTADAPIAAASSVSASTAASAPAPAAASVSTPTPSGRQLWSVQTQGKTTRIVEVAEGRVYALAGAYLEFGSPTRFVMSLEAETGRVFWSRDMGETIFSEAFLSDGTVVLGATDGKRTVLDAKTGATIAKKPPKEAPKPAAADLDCKGESGKIVCRDVKVGALIWQSPVAEPLSRITSLPGKVCFARARVLTIECRKADDGAMLWAHTVPRVPNVKEPEEIHFDYRVDGEVLYVANDDGTITALKMGK